MRVRSLFRICGPTVAAILAAHVALAQRNAPQRPSFLFVLIDDLGFMDIGANNPDCFYETPNIDRLARTGVRFTDGYAANPTCSPTRYSIMTGKYPTRGGLTNWLSGKRVARFAGSIAECL